MNPNKADDSQTAQESERGIRKMTEARYHKKPWKLTLYHSGQETRSFHATFEEAKAEKVKKERLKAKEGTRAFDFTRAAQHEYEAAKKLLIGTKFSVLDAVKDFAARVRTGRPTIAAVCAELVATKESKADSLAHATIKQLRLRLAAFTKLYPEGALLESVTRNEIVDWLTDAKHEWSPRTIWNYYTSLTALFNYAMRRDAIDKNPMLKIVPDVDLPPVRKAKVGILTVEQGEAFMRHIERHVPQYIGWACVQYFLGVRDAEAERLRGDWIDAKKEKVSIPGWYLDEEDEDQAEQGITKTRDDWVMDKLPPAFWAWVKAYPAAFQGRIAFPNNRNWVVLIREPLIEAKVFKKWPANALRHGFATYHLSWHRNATATSLILRHRDQVQLWNSYFAKLVDEKVGEKYLSLPPVSDA